MLDRFPREIRVGLRPVPTFLVTALVGLAAATFVLVALTALAGADVLVALGIIPIGVTASLVLALVRQRGARIERWVLLEHFALGGGAMVAALAGVGEPLLPWLDRVFAAFCILFAFGRLGCVSAGCCYGHRSSLGIDAGPSHVAGGRRFPVQVLEGGSWMACAVLAVVLSVVARAGIAFATGALLASLSRFCLEGLRADERPHMWGLSESRWLAIALAAVAVFVLHDQHAISFAGYWLGGAGLGVAVLLWLTSRVWLKQQPEAEVELRSKLVELASKLATSRPDLAAHRLDLPRASVVATWLDTGKGFELYVSVSAPGPRVMGPAEAELLLETFGEGLGIRGETPALVETGAGHYVTRFARDEIHVAAPRPPAPAADNMQQYFAPRSVSADAPP